MLLLVHRPETPDPLCPNEFEVETSALAPEDGAEAEAWRLIRQILHLLRPHMRLWRRVLAWSVMPLALLLVLSMIVAQTISDQATAAPGDAPVRSAPGSLAASVAGGCSGVLSGEDHASARFEQSQHGHWRCASSGGWF